MQISTVGLVFLLAACAAASDDELKHPDWHPEGDLLVAEGSCHAGIGLYLIDSRTGSTRLLFDSENVDGYPRWFADGMRITFHQIDDNRESRIVIADFLDQGGLTDIRHVTSGPFDIEPSPSPDGTTIAFSVAGESGQDIASLNLETSVLKVWKSSAAENFPSWHPGGNAIVFHARDGDGTHIYMRSLPSDELRRLTEAGSPNLVGHLDGSASRLVFSSERDDDREVYLKDLDSGDETRVTVRPGRDGYPKFSPDGKRIAYHQTSADGQVSVRILDLESGESHDFSCADRQDAAGAIADHKDRLAEAARLRAAKQFATAQAILDEMANAEVDQVPVRLEQSRLHAARGDSDAAISSLNRTLDLGGDVAFEAVSGEPVFSAVRAHSQYEKLMRRMLPCSGPQFTDAGFLAGVWNVVSAGNPHGPAEYFKVTEQVDGCAFLAEYGTVYDYKYVSLIFHDPQTGKWHQRGVDSQGFAMHMEGEFRDESLVLEYNDSQYLYRSIYTPIDDSRMRNEILRSADNGATWSGFFEGEFIRKEDGDAS